MMTIHQILQCMWRHHFLKEILESSACEYFNSGKYENYHHEEGEALCSVAAWSCVISFGPPRHETWPSATTHSSLVDLHVTDMHM